MLPRHFFSLLVFVVCALGLHAGLASSPKEVRPLSVGASTPAAQVKTIEDATVTLADVIRDKPTLLVFYRGSWCPYCNTHLAALAELEPQLLALGYQILAVSPDSAAGLKAAADKNKLNYRLLSDDAMQASLAFGVAFRVDEKTVKTYTGYGINLAPIPGEPGAHWLPVPAVFLINREGIITFAHTNPDYKARLSAEAVLAAAKAAR